MHKTLTTIAVLAFICACLLGGYSIHHIDPDTEVREVTIATSAETEVFDTTHLAQWCQGEPQGTIRMLGGEIFNYEPSNNTYVIKDETGELWVIRDVTLDEDDFLLLWIANNETPNDIEDDMVIKLWREAR